MTENISPKKPEILSNEWRPLFMTSDTNTAVAPVHRFILLTDIVQSSRLAEQYPREYEAALARHNQLVEQAVVGRGGEVYKQTGDGYLVLFETAGICLDAALELGEAFGRFEPLAVDEPLLVRLALHAGELKPSGSEYFGPALNRVSRICQVCNPGQVLCSATVVGTRGRLPDGVTLSDLGRHHLRDLAEPEQLYQLDSERFSRHEFPPVSTLDNRPNNLVAQPNAFIGREQELKELAELLLGSKRLVSITAPGGYGKSRLSAQLCANLLHRFEQGVFMVYLAPVRESLDVPTAIASALGYQFTAGRTPGQQLSDYLRAKELLLCLDNFEHLLDCAPLVAELLQAAPKLKVVITSREPLRLQGEHIYRLEPLVVEVADGARYSEAQNLFADRAALVSNGFTLTSDNAAQVQRICRQLSGIPLAIELAAAWMDTFALGELGAELSQQLELEARASDRPERHQSLKACLDWSWNLLGGEQETILMRLSTFRGGFFSDAAAAVLGMQGMKLRATLGRLADKSWLYSREVDSQARFYLRDMLAHEYAFAKLEATRGADDSLFEQAVRAHAEYFVTLVKREGPRLRGGGTPDGGAAQMAAARIWQLELDNILEALDTALHRGEVNWLVLFARHLQRYLYLIGSYDAQLDRYRLLLEAAKTSGHGELRMYAQLGLSRAQRRLGNYSIARDLLEQALALSQELGDRSSKASILNNLGLVEQSQGNYGAARALFEEVLALYRELDDPVGESHALNNLGLVEENQGNYSAARELLEQALALSQRLGSLISELNCVINIGIVANSQGNYRAARELFEQGLVLSQELGDRNGKASILNNLGNVARHQGNTGAARELQEQALALYRELGDRRGEAIGLGNLAIVAGLQGNYSSAGKLYGQALALCRELSDKTEIALCCACAGAVLVARGRLQPGALAMHGGQHGAAGLGYVFDPQEQQLLDSGLGRLDATVADGTITTDELAQWRAEGEAMSLDQLADLVLSELSDLNDGQRGDEAGPEAEA